MVDLSDDRRGPVDVTVVLPVYNEVGHLAQEVDRVHAGFADSELTYEVLVIDDGSTDGSRELARELTGVRVLQFERNRGSGAVRRIGTASARGQIVVWTDVDMTYPNDRIPALVAEMDGHDHVVGARRTEEGTARLLRTPAKWLIRQLAQWLTGQRIPDLNSGFRAFRKDVAGQFLHLLPNGFSCVTTLTIAFLTSGYSVKYVDIDYAERAGVSKFHWWRDTRKYVLQVVRMTLLYEPLRVLGPPGSILLAAGLGKALYDAITDPIIIAINTIVVLLIASLILLVGLLSDLIVQVTRPRNLILPAASHVADQPGSVSA